MNFDDYDLLDEFHIYDPVKDDARLDFSIPQQPTEEEELQQLITGQEFDYSIDRKADALWYYEKYPNFPMYMYPILQEVSTGIKPDRKQLRKIILKERKRMKKIKKMSAEIERRLNEHNQQNEEEI